MKNVRINYFGFEIDKLTESVEHVLSGKSFATDVSLVLLSDLKQITSKEDYIYMNLIESAPSNKGKNKVYLGVLGNLVAFGCRLSFQRRINGFFSFHSKTKLIEHYIKTLGAYHFGGHLMVIDNVQAKVLVDKYFKN